MIKKEGQAQRPKTAKILAIISAVIILLGGAGFYFFYIFVLKDKIDQNKESSSQTTTSPTTSNPQKKFSQKSIDYFIEIALKSEYPEASTEATNVVRKWVKNPVYIKLFGKPDSQSLTCLNDVITDFNNLSTSVKLKISSKEKDIEMHFVAKSRFKSIEPNYIEGNEGFFWGSWNDNYEYYQDRILINTQSSINETERCHLIREELTQSMGLANDSDKYEESIFYIEWTSTNSYAEIDKDLIEMLYATDLKAGATEEEVRKSF